ncbi:MULTISPECIES: hypothetical protein [unclassified Saccharibacter]|uniref:hypothetical protein n=1 Tax=unclassified Saccharibacter TaxID=2648722 RepID=UPI00132953E3|nr:MULTISPECIES: hypothetical protein [unclassified Saccharibacter]MXV35817.1 hypothetical protein [Saccharibacter sp. EH611]MXV57938.1 hypothetical protein [Saccharibacter sp. EH70]MXV66333.1 hypothetical protein [Saccharibacter sp. EH60]
MAAASHPVWTGAVNFVRDRCKMTSSDLSIKANPKKKGRGRPATGKDPMLGGRVPAALIQRIEGWAAAHNMTRSEAVRRLLQKALDDSEAVQEK